MVWVAILFFTALGLFLIIRRREISRGQSMVLGGRIAPGCVVAQGILILLLAVAFWVLHRLGILGAG
jgi:hypothetical protein